MDRRARVGAGLAAVVLAAAAPARGDDTMVRIVTRTFSTLDDPGNGFAAKPKVTYRVADTMVRVEEAKDTQRGIHGLFISHEPDAWIINLANHTGRHLVDSGPTFVTRVPLFGSPNEKELLPLELGHELEFIASRKQEAWGTEDVEGVRCQRYELTLGKHRVTLWIDPKKKVPRKATYVGEQATVIIFYDAYERLSVDPSLFRPPPGIAIQEPPGK
jgi:hypothetical protein